MPAGRPLKYKSATELQQKIDLYFAECDAKGKPYTISGLAYALDTSRKVLLEYQARDEFGNTVTRAKQKIESFVEESLWEPKISSGIAFNLKNNFGWRDKTETEISGSLVMFAGEDKLED